MSSTSATAAPARLAGLAQAADGFRNLRAVSSLLATYLSGALLVGLGGLTGSPALIGLLTLVALLLVLVGISAAGIHLMGQLHGLEPRSFMPGLFEGLVATGKIIVLLLVFLLLAVAFLIPVALILLICKIPLLGPLLYTFAVPLLTVVGGLYYAGLFVAWQMLGPAIWAGNTMVGSLARLAAIARQRAVEVIINLVILSLLMLVASSILASALGVGYTLMSNMSGSILGNQLSGTGLLGAAMGALGSGAASGHDVALGIGTSLVVAIGVAIIICPALMGLNIIYNNASEGIDASDMESRLTGGLQQARAKAGEMQELARRRAEEMQQKAREAAARRAAATDRPVAGSDAATGTPAAPRPAAPGPVAAGPAAASDTGQSAMRPCPACGHPNAASAGNCSQCGTGLNRGSG